MSGLMQVKLLILERGVALGNLGLDTGSLSKVASAVTAWAINSLSPVACGPTSCPLTASLWLGGGGGEGGGKEEL